MALNGKHLIAGEWIGGSETFCNEPVDGPADNFFRGTEEHVNQAAVAAEDAFWSYGYSTCNDRACFLRTIADEIESRSQTIISMGAQETGLPKARLTGELGRTTGQLRLFANHIQNGVYLDRRHDEALPDRTPLPRVDLKMVQRPIGPVAVFGASNFPLAFSTAGGDTAAALAAGCPVVVKGHSAHPGTADIVAQAVEAAITKYSMHPGVFSQIQGGNRSVGYALVTHPNIKAVGFTGSLAGGRALFDLCASRPEPIPFFGELGSINPVFILPNALSSRGEKIARDWIASLTLGAGQFCTNPGIAIIVEGPDADRFAATAAQALSQVGEQIMLSEGILNAYRRGCQRLTDIAGIDVLHQGPSGLLYQATFGDWMTHETLGEEVFGPFGGIVTVSSVDQALDFARKLDGQLTCTLQLDEDDLAVAAKLLPVLERKAGRVLANGFPTGVEVCDAMVHGGPYPASTNFGATSVGTLAIRRFLRPVCYQDIPAQLLPNEFSAN
ncbi:aldehyde dehydrogenase (NADP(+)) [Ruegeria sp. EL01]|jgi:NADP-dependent aldehyde dehydrogenase|uniref:aldehyde dehydrogenase (NADP(+)) n=1 Tax=Ruegeria sp. EL01 TaxID=2107578 RepID=UPI000EA81A3B|nr:aldehyde dehydrogenase (NADP(+)) [Ruegeria sp. EL01]